MAKTGLLVLTNPARVTKLLPVIKKHVLKTLYIQYFPEKTIFSSGRQGIANLPIKGPHYAQTVANLYSVTSVISSRLDIRVLLSNLKNPGLFVINTKRPIEVVIFDEICSKKEAKTFIQDRLSNKSTDCDVVTFNEEESLGKLTTDSNDVKNEKTYKNVVLGGTFDRIHSGHKIFLTEAALRCTQKLTVGVTDVNMLAGKLLWELIEPCPKRISDVKDFLEDVDSTIQYDVLAINDMYGPTKDDPSFDLIVVSQETKRGGEKVNEKRLENKLNPLDIYAVDLVNEDHYKEHEEKKISSSNQRIRLLGTHLKAPRIQDKSLKPYIIGLTGGIASGKSSVAAKLEKLGAGLVNCDTLAHELYVPGTKCYNSIVETFGKNILQADGYIDRKILGSMVFSDKAQLERLNQIVWPILLEETRRRINALYMKGFNIVVMEAAVLLQANWHGACHEIWTCIIPQAEAVKRVVNRNALTENEAQARIQFQPSNVEQVNAANVVICTLWSEHVTQEQVERGWNELATFLKEKADS